MSKKHFIAIAKALNEAQDISGAAKAALADKLADIFKAANPAFDKARFVAAVLGA